MAGKPWRWPATKAEVEALISPALAASQTLRDAATALGVTEAALRGVVRFHQIDFASLLGRPVISPGVAASGAGQEAPAWQGYRPRTGWEPPAKTNAAQGRSADVRRVAIIPDTHVPFHDQAAWSVALSIVREWKPHRVILIGDFMDTESVSSHGKGTPDTVRLAEEFHEANLRLDELQDSAPDATWLYLEGNHEARIGKWCNEFGNMDGLLDAPSALYMTPRDEGYHRSSSLLRGMEWVPLSRQPYQIDGCAYLHGVYENMYHAAFHALHLGPEIGCKEIRFGHMHTLQSAISPAGYQAACVGFLGDKAQRVFKYKKGKPAPWALGLVLQEIGGGLVTDTQVRIVGGRALLAGRVLQAA